MLNCQPERARQRPGVVAARILPGRWLRMLRDYLNAVKVKDAVGRSRSPTSAGGFNSVTAQLPLIRPQA
jgi:hypothetical protein